MEQHFKNYQINDAFQEKLSGYVTFMKKQTKN